MNSANATKQCSHFPIQFAARLLMMSFLSAHFLLAADTPAAELAAPAHADKLALREHWTLQSSAKVEAKGETISTAAFVPRGWHDATVPTTVVAALVKDKTLPDPFFAMNLRQFAGVTYPIGGNFSNIPMQTDSPYAVSWWYRKQFRRSSHLQGKNRLAEFQGDQLPSQRLAQRKADRQLRHHRRSLAHL